MQHFSFVVVDNDVLIQKVAILADEIWHEHYTSLIGKAQVDYMLEKFQSRQAITGQIKDGYQYFLIKDDKGFYVGYIGIVQTDDGLMLSKLYVRSGERGKGCGKKAVEMVEMIAKGMDLPVISLTVNRHNESSIEAYKRMGFRIKGEAVTDIGSGFVMDDYVMEKKGGDSAGL